MMLRKNQSRAPNSPQAPPFGNILCQSRILGGLALMVLPTLVAGNELLILGGVGVAVAAWFLAHRHGRLQGFVDANRNGVDDRVEGR